MSRRPLLLLVAAVATGVVAGVGAGGAQHREDREEGDEHAGGEALDDVFLLGWHPREKDGHNNDGARGLPGG